MRNLIKQDDYSTKIAAIYMAAPETEKTELAKIILNPAAKHSGFPENYAHIMESGTPHARTLEKTKEFELFSHTREEMLARGYEKPTLRAVLAHAGVNTLMLSKNTLNGLDEAGREFLKHSRIASYRYGD